jgi:hypothetical protein
MIILFIIVARVKSMFELKLGLKGKKKKVSRKGGKVSLNYYKAYLLCVTRSQQCDAPKANPEKSKL